MNFVIKNPKLHNFFFGGGGGACVGRGSVARG